MFAETVGAVGWEVDLANVKSVAATKDGRALSVTTTSGEEYVAIIMDPSMTRTSPKKVLTVIESALKAQAANNR